MQRKMLSYTEFEHYMNIIKKQYDWIEDICNVLNAAVNEVFMGISISIELLERCMNDTNDWISWYIFETEWGDKKNMLTVKIYDTEIVVDSIEKLYRVLELDYLNKGR